MQRLFFPPSGSELSLQRNEAVVGWFSRGSTIARRRGYRARMRAYACIRTGENSGRGWRIEISAVDVEHVRPPKVFVRCPFRGLTCTCTSGYETGKSCSGCSLRGRRGGKTRWETRGVVDNARKLLP